MICENMEMVNTTLPPAFFDGCSQLPAAVESLMTGLVPDDQLFHKLTGVLVTFEYSMNALGWQIRF